MSAASRSGIARHTPGGEWVITLDESGAQARAKTLHMARKRLTKDLGEGVELVLRFEVDEALQRLWAEAEQLEAERARLQVRITTDRATVITKLMAQGVSSREIAAMFGHTRQNIERIAQTTTPPAPAPVPTASAQPAPTPAPAEPTPELAHAPAASEAPRHALELETRPNGRYIGRCACTHWTSAVEISEEPIFRSFELHTQLAT